MISIARHLADPRVTAAASQATGTPLSEVTRIAAIMAAHVRAGATPEQAAQLARMAR